MLVALGLPLRHPLGLFSREFLEGQGHIKTALIITEGRFDLIKILKIFGPAEN